MITSKQAKLINLGLLVKKFEMFRDNAESEWASAIYHSQYEKYRDEYFDLWFELNRENIENKYIIYASEKWIEINEIEQDVTHWSSKFIEFCLERCFENL